MIPQRGTKKETVKERREEKEQDRDIESEERERTAAKPQESRWRRLEGLRETELKSRRGKWGKMEGEDRWLSADLRSVLGNARSPGD